MAVVLVHIAAATLLSSFLLQCRRRAGARVCALLLLILSTFVLQVFHVFPHISTVPKSDPLLQWREPFSTAASALSALFAISCPNSRAAATKRGAGAAREATITLRNCVIAHVDLSRLSDSETAAAATAPLTAAASGDDVESAM